jgi:hypothetical protein
MDHYYNKIHGWFNFHAVYTNAVNTFPDNSLFVEIGSWKGTSAAYMGVELINANKKNTKFVCVDTWGENDDGEYISDKSVINNTLYQEFLDNIKPLQNNGLNIVPIRNRSDLAVSDFMDSSIDFLYIDGSHHYKNVKNDILLYLPKMKTTSIVAGHDWQSPDVRRAAVECFGDDKITIHCKNTWVVQINK